MENYLHFQVCSFNGEYAECGSHRIDLSVEIDDDAMDDLREQLDIPRRKKQKPLKVIKEKEFVRAEFDKDLYAVIVKHCDLVRGIKLQSLAISLGLNDNPLTIVNGVTFKINSSKLKFENDVMQVLSEYTLLKRDRGITECQVQLEVNGKFQIQVTYEQ
jgi:hypothetical protein